MSEITLMLSAKEGEPDFQLVFDKLYAELKKLAGARLAMMSGGRTLTPTVLVHEAYDRLVNVDGLDLKSRRHFFALASRTMRHIIIDHLRASGASKRGGDLVAVTLTEAVAAAADTSELLDLDQALDELDQINPLHRELVELRFFGGLPMAECAELLEISPRTAWREWQRARAFLHVRMAQPQA
jgi:RNA polymerase sigma factor (TIGR02999 family)